jgi:hypothetical protein
MHQVVNQAHQRRLPPRLLLRLPTMLGPEIAHNQYQQTLQRSLQPPKRRLRHRRQIDRRMRLPSRPPLLRHSNLSSHKYKFHNQAPQNSPLQHSQAQHSLTESNRSLLLLILSQMLTHRVCLRQRNSANHQIRRHQRQCFIPELLIPPHLLLLLLLRQPQRQPPLLLRLLLFRSHPLLRHHRRQLLLLRRQERPAASIQNAPRRLVWLQRFLKDRHHLDHLQEWLQEPRQVILQERDIRDVQAEAAHPTPGTPPCLLSVCRSLSSSNRRFNLFHLQWHLQQRSRPHLRSRQSWGHSLLAAGLPSTHRAAPT